MAAFALLLGRLRFLDAKGSFQNLSANRHSRLGAIAALLHHHSHYHSRIVKGAIGHKPAVVPAMGILCRTCLACNLHGEIPENRSSCTKGRHIVKTFLHQTYDFRPYIQAVHQHGLKLLNHLAIRPHNTVHQMGLKTLAIRRNLPHDHSGLERRHQIKALADGSIKGLGQVPVSILKILFLILAVSHQAI